MIDIKKIDGANNLAHAESLTDYEARIEYCAAKGEPFKRSILIGGRSLYDPNPGDVMNRFRRLWREAHK